MLSVEGLQLKQVSSIRASSDTRCRLSTGEHGGCSGKGDLLFVPEQIRSNKQTKESDGNCNPLFKDLGGLCVSTELDLFIQCLCVYSWPSTCGVTITGGEPFLLKPRGMKVGW